MSKPRESASLRDPVAEILRRNLESFIDQSGYSQTQVADLSGIPQANLGRYVRGESTVPATALGELANVFGCSVADFYLTTPPPIDVTSAAPVFLRHRPGADWTEEDQKDADEMLERMKARRAKKSQMKRK